jgi:SH3-like domain-containing protein
MPMKLAVVAASLAALSGVAAWSVELAGAAEGDRLSVSRANVNVRAGPSTNAEILLTIDAGEAIVEIAEKGEWFFVEFPNLNKKGWIYGPLLDAPGTVAAASRTEPAAPAAAPKPEAEPPVIAAPAAPSPPEPTVAAAPAPEPAPAPAATAADPAQQAAAGQEPAAVKSFRETVVELNERAVSVAGINLFTDVRSTGGGGIQVLATETWTTVPEAGQSSYMNALFERWQSMASGLGPLTLQILDPTGNVVMQRSDS